MTWDSEAERASGGRPVVALEIALETLKGIDNLALDLDGANDYAWVADHADFDITSDLTIECHINPDVVAGTQFLLDKGGVTALQNAYGLELVGDEIRMFGTANGAPGTLWIVGTTVANLLINTWYTIKAVYDAGATEVSIYLDGIEIARANNVHQEFCTLAGTIPAANFSSTTRVTIGADSANGNKFNGEIDFIGVEARENDNGDALAKIGSRGYWNMNQRLNAAGDLPDQSGNEHDLTVVHLADADFVTVEASQEFTLRLSDVGLADSEFFWEPKIISASIKRAVNIQTNEVVSPEALITFEDVDGEIASLLSDNDAEIQGKIATLYSKFIADDGAIQTETMAVGIVEIRSQTTTTTTIALRPLTIEKLGLLQQQIDDDLSPSVPAQEIGKGFPVLVGEVRTAGTFDGKNLPVRCPMVNDFPNQEIVILHQGPGNNLTDSTLLRERNGIILDLGQEGLGNWNLSGVFSAEAEVGRIRTVIAGTLTAAAGYLDGDNIYVDQAAGVHGRGTVSFITFDGTNDYYTATAAERIGLSSLLLPDDAQLDFGTDNGPDAFTIEIKFRPATIAAGADTLIGINDSTPANKRSWLLYRNANNLSFNISQDGTAVKIYRTNTTALVAGVDHTVRVACELGVDVKIWINGVAQALIGGGGVPYDSLFDGIAADVDFMIGAADTGAGFAMPWEGRIYYVLVAEGAQDLASGTTDDRDSPLADIYQEWGMWPASQILSYVGNTAPQGVSLARADYASLENNDSEHTPAWVIDRLLRWTSYWNLPPEFIDRDSFATLAAEQEVDGWDDFSTKPYAGVIPWEDNSPIELPATKILGLLLKSQDAVLYENIDGKLSIASADIVSLVATPDENIGEDDFTEADVTIVKRPFQLLNHARYRFRLNNKGGSEFVILADDLTSQAAYGLTTEDTEITLHFVRSQLLARDIITRQMLRLAGDAIQVEFDLTGLWGARINPAETLAITHPQHGWTSKQFYVLSVAPDFIAGVVRIKAISRGDVHGPIIFS